MRGSRKFCQRGRFLKLMRGGPGPTPPPLPKKSQKIRFLSNTGQEPMQKYKSAKPALNIGRSTARQPLNGVSLAGRLWSAYTCSGIWFLYPSHQLKKTLSELSWTRSFIDLYVSPTFFCHLASVKQKSIHHAPQCAFWIRNCTLRLVTSYIIDILLLDKWL